MVRLQMPGLRPYLIVTDSTQRNLELIERGKASMAFASADTIASLPSGETSQLTTLGRLYDDYLHLVVRPDSGIGTLSDLRGKRVSIGIEGSSTQRTVKGLLSTADISTDDLRTVRTLGVDASADALARHDIDAFFFFGGVPTRRLDPLKPFRLVDLAEWVPELRAGYGDFYSEQVIPPSAYGSGTSPVTTVGVPTYLVVPKSMDPDLAYALTAMLFDHRDAMASVHPAVERLDRRAAINTLPLKLHKGAVAYYRDTKI
jgi:TRAP transporter TAXI family solute receptor